MVPVQFLEACESIISIFDCLGSGLGVVKSDMLGNVTHIRRNLAGFPPEATLFAMVQKDVDGKVHEKDGSTALSLLWLKRYERAWAVGWKGGATNAPVPPTRRALQFLERLLAHLIAKEGTEVADAGRSAYGETLTHHHNFAVRQVFKVRSSVSPGGAVECSCQQTRPSRRSP